MDFNEIEQIKRTLNQWLDGNSRNANEPSAKFSESPDNLADPLDRAYHQLETYLEINRRNREGLSRIKVLKALRKIEKGLYGICEECGEEISIKRLRAIPDTSFCLSCKLELEKNKLPTVS
jgi:DnaK suppressor protein